MIFSLSQLQGVNMIAMNDDEIFVFRFVFSLHLHAALINTIFPFRIHLSLLHFRIVKYAGDFRDSTVRRQLALADTKVTPVKNRVSFILPLQYSSSTSSPLP